MELKVGMRFQKTVQVTSENTALAVGSGDVEVFATPMMIALMEGAAAEGLGQYLSAEQTSVGGQISSSHIAATPVGMTVTATAEVTGIDRNRVSFAISASDEAGLIGEGEHLRFIVEREKFLSRAQAKRQ